MSYSSETWASEMGKSASNSSDCVKNCYRGHWRPAEDEKLRQLVDRYGPQNWNFIAEHLEGRSGRETCVLDTFMTLTFFIFL